MIGNSILEYLFIRASITAIRLIAPTSILYLAASAYYATFIVSPWIGAFAIAEASFYLLVYLPRKWRIQAPPNYKPPPLTRPQREALFDKCCADLKHEADNGAPYPRGWFSPLDVPLCRQDVIDWLLWALFSCERQEAKMEEWKEELEAYVKMIEVMLGENLNEGRGEGIKTMRLTLDPVKVVHRPLVWYSIVALVDTTTSLNLLYCGFKHYSSTRKWFQTFPPRPLLSVLSRNADLSPDILLPYWYRPHKSTTKLPIIFLHGIGIGLHPYLPFIRDIIAQDPDVGIILIELLPISMHMTSQPIAPRPLLIKALTNILDTLDLPHVVLAAHSYGTFLSAYILRPPPPVAGPDTDTHAAHLALRARIRHTLLVDPIPLLLHLPPVAHNFLYRTPRAAAEWQLWFFASTDADVARTLGRAFFWEEGVLWREDLAAFMRGGGGSGAAGEGGGESRGRNLMLVLAEKDQIVPAESVRRYLTQRREPCARWAERNWSANVGGSEETGSGAGGDLEVLFYPGLDHATVFDTPERRAGMLEALHHFVRDDREEEVVR